MKNKQYAIWIGGNVNLRSGAEYLNFGQTGVAYDPSEFSINFKPDGSKFAVVACKEDLKLTNLYGIS